MTSSRRFRKLETTCGGALARNCWLSSCRRLSKHYEYWNETGEAMVQVAMIRLMLRRLAKETPGVGVA